MKRIVLGPDTGYEYSASKEAAYTATRYLAQFSEAGPGILSQPESSPYQLMRKILYSFTTIGHLLILNFNNAIVGF